MAKMGRPVGSTTRPQIKDYINKDDTLKLVETALYKAFKDKDTVMIKFLMEQMFGKAPQSLDLSTLGKELRLNFDGIFKATSKTEGDSKE